MCCWHHHQRRGRHRYLFNRLLLLFGGRRFVPLAFTLFCCCLLTVLIVIFAGHFFSNERNVGFNANKWTDSANSLLAADTNAADTANDDDDANGGRNGDNDDLSKGCQCGNGADGGRPRIGGWRAHFSPVEAEARVFQSVRREHIELMGKLNEAQAKMDTVERQMGEKGRFFREEAELAKLVLRVEELKLLHKEYSDKRAVRVQLPHAPPKRRQTAQQQIEEEEEVEESDGNSNDSQFNFSRCPITVPSMPLAVHHPLSVDGIPSASPLATQFHRQFVSGQQIASIATSPTTACLSITIIETDYTENDDHQNVGHPSSGTDQNVPRRAVAGGSGTFLSHHFTVNGAGQNHLVLDLRGVLSAVEQQQLLGTQSVLVTPRASNRHHHHHHHHFSVLPLHLDVPMPSVDGWRQLPPLLPAMRKYFVRLVANPAFLGRRQLADLAQLKKSMDSSLDAHLIDLDCPLMRHHQSNSSDVVVADHFCYPVADRLRMGRQSVFTILLFPELPSFQQLFYESLLAGSVPVLCSRPPASLPFAPLIDWRLATVQIAVDRFPELHFILRAIPLADLLELKRMGRFFFEHYLADTKVVVDGILSAMRVLLQLPGGEKPEPDAVPLYNNRSAANFSSTGGGSSFSNASSLLLSSLLPAAAVAVPSFISTLAKPPYDDEYLGPIEPPLESPAYVHNFTALFLYSAQLWNHFPPALGFSPRFLPFSHAMPSDAEFGEDTAFGMRPILPGSGSQFALALGGNRAREQFTIVILAHNRDYVLLNTLERLNNLPYLSRVLVIWNDVYRPPSVPAWPRLHVPLLFINGTRNSLNNRFIPYKEIETEAILSMDDDMDIKQFEIVFAFRVWRENRDRIVGFPARFHARFGDDNFYNSNHTCQYSMILTGAAFIHKFYLHAYTYHMPEIVRLKVDEWMNCEDLAMNFLVAHLTRKAPIKTTSKWTLRCPSCPEMLSNDESHFVERHQCIRFFTRVYGYNPLVFTQFRADSVLFKTRVPQNHQKCFRYV